MAPRKFSTTEDSGDLKPCHNSTRKFGCHLCHLTPGAYPGYKLHTLAASYIIWTLEMRYMGTYPGVGAARDTMVIAFQLLIFSIMKVYKLTYTSATVMNNESILQYWAAKFKGKHNKEIEKRVHV